MSLEFQSNLNDVCMYLTFTKINILSIQIKLMRETKKRMEDIDDNSMKLTSIDDFQISTNQPETKYNWRDYLNEIFKDIQPSINLHEIRILSYPSDLYYLQKVTELLSGLSRAELLFSYMVLFCDGTSKSI